MSDKLIIVINGQSVIEYDRNVRLPGHQRQFLDKMDLDMDNGIELFGESIVSPDSTQRAQFVAMHLIQSIINDDEGLTAATCAYLANRFSDLKQVKANEQGEQISFDLVFDQEYKNAVAVEFDPGLMSKPTKH